MTFKNFEIYGIAENLLRAFAEADSTQKLPIKLSYTIKKNTSKFQSIAEQIEAGKKSVAFNITMRSSEGTLTDEQAGSAMQKMMTALEKLGAILRS